MPPPPSLEEDDPGGPVIKGTTTGGVATFRRHSPEAATPWSSVGYTALWHTKSGRERGVERPKQVVEGGVGVCVYIREGGVVV